MADRVQPAIRPLDNADRIVPGVIYVIGYKAPFSVQSEDFVVALSAQGISVETALDEWSVARQGESITCVFTAQFRSGELAEGAKRRIKSAAYEIGVGEPARCEISEVLSTSVGAALEGGIQAAVETAQEVHSTVRLLGWVALLGMAWYFWRFA